MKTSGVIILLTALVLFPYSTVTASFEEEALITANNAIGNEIGDSILTDQDGRSFNIRDLVGKPFVISLIYTDCGHVCPAITAHLQGAVQKAGDDFGKRFTALTLGFDIENDTPERMKKYGMNFTDDFKKWSFASTDQNTIDSLARDLGFTYRKLNRGFDHINMVTIVDPKGKIYAQVYGLDFKPEDVLDPLYQSMKQIKAPQTSPLSIIDRAKLFCYKYDETSGKFKFDYGLLITLSVGIMLQAITIVAFIYIVLRKGKGARRRRALSDLKSSALANPERFKIL